MAPKTGNASMAPKTNAPKTGNASAKAEKKEAEEARRAARDKMMLPGSDDDGDDDDDGGADERPRVDAADARGGAPRAPATDKFGNTLSKGGAADSAKAAELELARAEARARREAKAAAAAADAESAPIVDLSEKRRAEAEALRLKAAAGGKLSSKEKRLLSQLETREAEVADELAEVETGLAAFSLSVRGSTVSEGEVADADCVSATDVIIACFSVSAPARVLFADASLRLASGRRYGLLGPNGHGKSTLLRLLAHRRLPVPPGVRALLVEQEVAASELPVHEQVVAADTRRAALLAEERALAGAMEGAEADGWSAAEWTDKVRRLEQLSSELDAIGADAAEPLARRILAGLGFDQAMQDAGSTGLSGGWRMRVSLARALFVKPQLLLLDEPTNHLDLDAVLWLEDHLAKHWSGTILTVSHDVDFLAEVCTDLLSLDECALHHFGGSIHRYAEMRAQLEAKKASEYASQQKALKEAKKSGLTAEKALKDVLKKLHVPALRERPREYTVKFALRAPDDTDGMISVQELAFAYAHDGMSGGAPRQLFSGLSFKLDCTSRIALVGANGSGKTTLARLIAAELAPSAGEVSHSRRLRLGRYHQHFDELLPREQSPLEFLRRSYDLDEQDARKYLGMFGLDGARHLIRIGELSGGQKARVVFASLALQRPHILLLDEPTNHLDLESVEALVEGLRSFEGGVLLISHDARLISALECELWVCGEGEGGLRVERRGFDKYRADILAQVERRAQRAAVHAAARAAGQRAARLERLRLQQQRAKGGVK